MTGTTDLIQGTTLGTTLGSIQGTTGTYTTVTGPLIRTGTTKKKYNGCHQCLAYFISSLDLYLPYFLCTFKLIKNKTLHCLICFVF